MHFRFFSGFGFENEAELFDELLPHNRSFVVAGFSMGAIDAFNYAKSSNLRVENLILISPAFYQENDEKFKEFQLNSFVKNAENYQQKVYRACEAKQDISKYKIVENKENLKKLLYHKWMRSDLTDLVNNGTKITVYLGKKDRVIDAEKALKFFAQIATVHFYKNRNHLMEEL